VIKVQRIIVPDTRERSWVLFDGNSGHSLLRTNISHTCIAWDDPRTLFEPMLTIYRRF